MTDGDPPPSDGGWHLDRRVNLSIIITLIGNIAVTFWWASSTTTRLAAVEQKIEAASPQGERLTRVETKIESIQDGIAEIKRILLPKYRPDDKP